MFETIEEYKPLPIPEVKEGEAFWLLALGHLTRHQTDYWKDIDNVEDYNPYENWLREHAAGKTVCDLGGGTGVLLHLAEYYGAEKCISIDKNQWACVYTKGMYPHWDIIHHDFFKMGKWPEADIYLHKGIPEIDALINKTNMLEVNGRVFPQEYMDGDGKEQEGMIDYVNKHDRAFKELIRLGWLENYV